MEETRKPNKKQKETIKSLVDRHGPVVGEYFLYGQSYNTSENRRKKCNTYTVEIGTYRIFDITSTGRII